MKWTLAILISFIFSFSISAQSKGSPLGVWRTIDHESGEPKSHVEIYKSGNEWKAKVVKLLEVPDDTICTACPGDKKNKPVKGMVIMSGMTQNKDKYTGGTILDPKDGKEYKCQMWMEDKDRLAVRGYVGMVTFGRTQVWERVK
jgi:uncharacterized protein (DUF2147 family)